MKRVVAITIFMVMVTSLFAFSVSAAGPTTFNDYSATASNNNVSIKLRAVQFKSSSLGTSILPGGMESVFYVTCEIENSNTDAAILNPILFNITLSVDKTISHIYTYSEDLLIEKETYFKIVPSSDFSYDGMIVVPPETTLYFIGEICTTANLDQTGQTVDDAGLRGIDFVGTGSSYIVGHGNYPYGSPVDLSPAINNMIALCTYTGSQYTADADLSISYDSGTVDSTLTGVTTRVRRVVTPSSYITNDIEYESGNDTYYQSGTRERFIYLTVQLVNNLSEYVRLNNYNQIAEAIPVGIYSYEIVSASSDTFNGFTFMQANDSDAGRRMRFDCTNLVGNYGYIPPNTTYMFSVIIRLTYNDNQTLTYRNPSWRWIDNPRAAGNEIYAPRSIYNILRDLYLSLTESESSDNTEEAQEMNDDIHEAEQVWYDNNSEALEEVGLSNYRFSSSQSSGIAQAVTQFQAVWNALGNWTNVYIFILILSISTYIIRHEPTTRVKQYRSSVQAERAERISYYGRKNAESRASSSGSTFKAALRRRK